ncbi:YlaF family protein [Sporosarcina sp. G11-34]|uniref:YlaF family protein n=1 Tax=Sporosarcina sp. G11-34 TaxID=2849605 RepID=UPI0022A96A8B|nr:YlaF family protein [Sporosarcina sp. G11-34]MCZ2258917.1 YlaF family protein [Sporosarcina sp. G11-34]
MKDIKWVFVFFSIAAILSMCAIGISIAERSFPGAILAIIAFILVMGYGFKTKKKMRELGTL